MKQRIKGKVCSELETILVHQTQSFPVLADPELVSDAAEQFQGLPFLERNVVLLLSCWLEIF
jgi:hypothetical protein